MCGSAAQTVRTTPLTLMSIVRTQHVGRADRDGAAVADAGVGEHDVDAAERGHGAGDGAVHRRLVGHVGLEPRGAVAELVGERAQPLGLQAHQRDARALGGGAAGGLGADARARRR